MGEDLNQLLEDAEDTVAEEVSAVLAEVAEEFAQQLADATELVAARFSVSRIARMFTDRMPRIVRRLLRVSEQAAEHTADAVDGELSPEWEDLPGRYDDGRELPPAMSDYVDVTEHLLRAVGDRLADVAREELAAGVDAGEDIEQLRARLREAFAREGAQLGEVREERVARTEAGRAWNTATLGAARDATGTPAPIVKQWLSRRDDRVRHDHADANGQIRFLDEQFEVGDVKMDAPHDPTAPASQVVNCRCVLAVHPETSASAFDPSTDFHGTPGRPSYPKYHPSGRNKDRGLTRLPGGGVLGSDRFSEEEHLEAIRSYNGTGFREMNEVLRDGSDGYSPSVLEEVRGKNSALMDLISVQEPSTSEVTLYRGMRAPRRPVFKLSEGDEFHDKGFVSTSSEEGVGQSHAGNDEKAIMFTIVVPPGARMADMNQLRDINNSENEFVLPPGSKFRVRRVIRDDSEEGDSGPAHYELELINAVTSAATAMTHPSAERPQVGRRPAVDLVAASEDSITAERMTWTPEHVLIDKRAKASAFGFQVAPSTAVNEARRNPMPSPALTDFHGTQGRPSYRKYHPKGTGGGRTRHENGGLLGSNRFSEGEHRKVAESYTLDGYTDMNKWLRFRKEPYLVTEDEVQREVSVLTDLINVQDPTTEDTTLYRGMRGDFLDLKVGDEFHDKGFGSTSTGESAARKMLGVKGGIFFSIRVPKGAQVLDVASVGLRSDEGEVILPPGTQYRVKSVGQLDDPRRPATHYELEVVNAVTAAAAATARSSTAATTAAASAEDRFEERLTWRADDVVVDKRAKASAFHGTPGRPSYRKYHPKGAGSGGKTKSRGGAMLGSNRYDEADHKAALRSYRSYGYEKINGSLRHGDLPDDERTRTRIRDEVSTLTDLINIQEPTTSETTLYRRMENFRLELSEGDEFHDKGFVSTSSREDVLPVQVSPTDPNYTFFKVNLPSGAQVLDVDAVGVGGFGADEREFILPPGTAFRVTRIVDSGGPDTPPYYELEVTNAVYASAPWPEAHGTSLTAAEDDEETSDLQQRITWARDDIVMDHRADGASRTAADTHLQGAMIALLPTADDAARLALDGGEPAEEIHCTLFFLGEDASEWSPGERSEFIRALEAALSDVGQPIQGHVTGAAHWNTDTEKPSWVWTVSDGRDQEENAPTIGDARWAATVALEDTHHPEMPRQHSPWTAHICAAYTDEGWPYEPMAERIGPITFDRLRVAFGDEHTDIPLGPEQEEEIMAADTAQADPMLAVRTWSTPDDTAIAFEDQETGDGRIFAKGSLKWDRAPMPLQYADEMLMGHQGAELAGAILKVKRDGRRITASGPLYATRPAGADAIQLLGEGAPLGISVDLDDVDIEFVDKTLDPEDAEWLFASARLPHASVLPMEDGSVMLSASTAAEWTASDGAISRSRYDLQLISGPDGALSASVIRDAFAGKGVLTAAAGDADDPENGLVVHAQKSGDFLLRITRARLRGATLVSMPAFKDARIVLDPLDETAAAPVPSITAAGETRDRVVVYVCTSPAAVGARDVSRALGIAMSTARGHLNGAAKDGRIIRLAPGLFCGLSTMPEGELSAAMSGDTDLPVHQDPDASWDGDKASSRVLAWATDDDGNVDPEKLGAAFLWRDEDADPGTLAAYKLGFCDVFDSDDGPRLEIVAQAVYTIASVLQGGMGGVDVPEDEHEQLRGRVETLYGRLAKAYDDDSIRPPWADGDEDEDSDETASAGLRELEASAWTAMQQMPPMPAEWFREPTEEELPVDAGGVHYKDGRAFGWVATIDEPHAGYPGKNLTVRKLSAQGLDFTHFLRARFQLDDGTYARVGAMTMNVGHHRDGAECETAACQFDDSRTVGAIVTIGLNERGLWFSGASAPWLSEWDRAVFAACQPSYHLKQARDGSWQLRAVLTVPVPGHSTPLVAAMHTVAERANLALAASAAGFLPTAADASGHDPDARPDAVRTTSASSTGPAADLPGQRPDTAVASLEDVFLSDALVDRFLDRVAEREAARRAEVEAMAALVAQHAATETVAVQNGVI